MNNIIIIGCMVSQIPNYVILKSQFVYVRIITEIGEYSVAI
jgi:hypothetical protein